MAKLLLKLSKYRMLLETGFIYFCSIDLYENPTQNVKTYILFFSLKFSLSETFVSSAV